MKLGISLYGHHPLDKPSPENFRSMIGWKQFYGQFGQAAEMDDPPDFTQEFDDLLRDRFILDTPDVCIRAFDRYERELGVGFIMISVPGSAEDKLRFLKLFGETVVPHFIRESTAGS